MKVITVTKSNIRDIYGRLKKFYNNNNNTGFVEWHNFDCGFKKHINPYIVIGGQKVRVENKYTSYADVELDKSQGEIFIRIKLGPGEAGLVKIGDKIAFLGNRYIHREKSNYRIWGHNYIYSTYQVLPMDSKEQYRLNMYKESMHAIDESTYEADFLDAWG